ncbi:Serine/threonine protein phosphatase [Alloactinosynnema sp. L-07]|nr:Serine/threonine protein phosphatase [Alloactinosynnema sp. L-07]
MSVDDDDAYWRWLVPQSVSAGLHVFASCVCGWFAPAASRAQARATAKAHRDRPPTLPVFRIGTASLTGLHRWNTDAVATAVDDTTGRAAFALADGLGDNRDIAMTARIAARAAADAAVGGPAVAGLHGAKVALSDIAPWEPIGDVVMVVAVAMADIDGGGWDIAWFGDSRAYLRDGGLRQLTTDHTLGQIVRDANGPADVAARHDETVCTTVVGSGLSVAGMTRTWGEHPRLLLISDGLHRALPAAAISTAADRYQHPSELAARITDFAQLNGGTDNATAVVVDRIV